MQLPTVEEVFDQIMAGRQWNKKELAAYLGINQSVMSQKLGAQWNLHWRIFVKLLPDLIQFKVLGKEHLRQTSDNVRANKNGDGSRKSVKLQGIQPKRARHRRYIMSTLVARPKFSAYLPATY